MGMITRACYCNRDDAQRSVDFKPGIDVLPAIDRALMTASENIERNLHRSFYPYDASIYFDWPNQGGSGGGQYAYPWRLWFDQYDCTVLTSLVTGSVTIPLNQVFLEPVNNPVKLRNFYEYLELDRSSTAAFGSNSATPQHAIVATGTWGAGADADQVATLAADVGSSDSSIQVSDSSKCGVGDLLILGYGRGEAPFPSAAGYAGALAPFLGERVLVTDRATLATGLTQSGAGCTTISDTDNALTTTGSGALNVGEVLLLDQEQMLVTDTTGGIYTVVRAWNGTNLAAHGTATVYAYRQLSVTRAMYGTTATTASSGAAVFRHRVPSLVKDLAVAEAVNQILQEGSGYARTVGAGSDAHPAPGADLASKWDECMTAWGRKARVRAV
jgi:hypothetical protein